LLERGLGLIHFNNDLPEGCVDEASSKRRAESLPEDMVSLRGIHEEITESCCSTVARDGCGQGALAVLGAQELIDGVGLVAGHVAVASCSDTLDVEVDPGRGNVRRISPSTFFLEVSLRSQRTALTVASMGTSLRYLAALGIWETHGGFENGLVLVRVNYSCNSVDT
jgi:hypothetical protein